MPIPARGDFITPDKNEWVGWMIFHRKGSQIGLVPSSFTLSKSVAESTLTQRARQGEEVRQVRLILEE